MTTRAEVYHAIDTERAYQDKRWGSLGNAHGVAAFMVFMRHYLNQGGAVFSATSGPQATADALDFVRKVTTLGVACMEQNGAPVRPGFDDAPQAKGYGTTLQGAVVHAGVIHG